MLNLAKWVQSVFREARGGRGILTGCILYLWCLPYWRGQDPYARVPRCQNKRAEEGQGREKNADWVSLRPQLPREVKAHLGEREVIVPSYLVQLEWHKI